jgi:hypothetical protein
MFVDPHGYCTAGHIFPQETIDAVPGDAKALMIYSYVIDDFAASQISLVARTIYNFRHMSLDVLTQAHVGIKFLLCPGISAHGQYT